MTKKVYVVSNCGDITLYESKKEALVAFGKELLDDVNWIYKYDDSGLDVDQYQELMEYFDKINKLLNNNQTEIDFYAGNGEEIDLSIYTREIETETTTVEELNNLVEEKFKRIRETKEFMICLDKEWVHGKLIQTENELKIIDKETKKCYNIKKHKK